MDASDPDRKGGAAHGEVMRGRTRDPVAGRTVVDQLPDSFPVLADESRWLMTLLADELARIIADD